MEILLYANPIVNAYQGSDFFGKLIFLALFFLSIATWAVFIQKIRGQRAKNFSPLDAILKKQVSSLSYLEAHLKKAVSAEIVKMEKGVSFLSTTVSLAPFLGLLGTVWGILLTFSELQAGAAANANATVMGGLAMALGTTVFGLVVAIPALIAYNYLRTSIRHLSQEMEDYSQLLLASVEHERTR